MYDPRLFSHAVLLNLRTNYFVLPDSLKVAWPKKPAKKRAWTSSKIWRERSGTPDENAYNSRERLHGAVAVVLSFSEGVVLIGG